MRWHKASAWKCVSWGSSFLLQKLTLADRAPDVHELKSCGRKCDGNKSCCKGVTIIRHRYWSFKVFILFIIMLLCTLALVCILFLSFLYIFLKTVTQKKMLLGILNQANNFVTGFQLIHRSRIGPFSNELFIDCLAVLKLTQWNQKRADSWSYPIKNETDK